MVDSSRALVCKRTNYYGFTWAILLLGLAVWPLFMGPYVLHIAVLICLNILIVNGLSIIERSGQLSFGHSAFVALGAYGSVLLSSTFGLGSILASLLGIMVAALVALVLGAVILRLRGVYFVLVTFAFAELTRLALLDWSDITGGANGISAIPAFEVLGFAFDTRTSFYVLALCVVVLSMILIHQIFKHPLGEALTAVSKNAGLAESTGLNVYRLQLIAFVMGCALAALGGALMARYIGFVSPESFNLSISVALITMLVIGGRGSLWGPLIGAIVLTSLPEIFRGALQTQHIFYGVALILIIRFLPGGLVSIPSWFKKHKKV
ncbi:branched-chain amino acid ABC transporter permease [Alcaligenaceae bacterium CGII-47]|nr:branched-chain amino acid ABC transporter permease [Alcaligenaceae bacterium CGII-47]